jgi:hypothetical protein
MARLFLIAVSVLLLAAPALSKDDAATRKADKAAKAVRAKLPAPNPGISVAYKGDLVIDKLWAGEVSFAAKLAKVGREYVWRVTEDTFMDWQGGETRVKLMLHADKQLSILSGTYERSDAEGAVSLVFSRGEKGFDVQRRVRKGKADWGKTESLTMKAAPQPMGGLTSLLLFLRAAGPSKKPVSYRLPVVPESAWKKVESAEPATTLLACSGPGTWTHGKKSFKTSVVRYAPGGTSWDLHLSRDHRKLIAMVSTTGPVQIVPAGMAGARVAADPREAATTWKKAFLKFGFGYHMAREALLADAFHWPVMYEYEVKTLKRWDKNSPVADFKKAWIAEFIKGSLHRDTPATRRLLSMTLATGKVKKETATDVVFWAHPNFGGGTQRTYHFRNVDGIWGIWRIDF